MSHHTEPNNNNESTKSKRKSVQFGRVSYSDDSKEKELSIHSEHTCADCKFQERSAMCSSVPIPPPCPPQRKASAEVYLLDDEDENDEFELGSSPISMNSWLHTIAKTRYANEEEKEADDEETEESYHSRDSSRYTSPLISTRKMASPVAPSRTRPTLRVSPSQLPACFPARCL